MSATSMMTRLTFAAWTSVPMGGTYSGTKDEKALDVGKAVSTLPTRNTAWTSFLPIDEGLSRAWGWYGADLRYGGSRTAASRPHWAARARDTWDRGRHACDGHRTLSSRSLHFSGVVQVASVARYPVGCVGVERWLKMEERKGGGRGKGKKAGSGSVRFANTPSTMGTIRNGDVPESPGVTL
ncbi:hypothetical protein R3P38DRAFT_2803248 [Favolaschia claudopus]|uniref:Secreted protein n=1 Tax=Favolaschia claudopus TaxID=2862362 RepID=A0AAV9ZUQ7_9AGAR